MTPLIFLPPSKPRPKQLGADLQERLSMTTAVETVRNFGSLALCVDAYQGFLVFGSLGAENAAI